MESIEQMIKRLCPKGVEYVKLGEVASIKNGRDHKKYEDGDVPVYGSGGVMRHIETFIYNKPSVLLPRKGSLGNVLFVDEPFWTVDTMFWTVIDRRRVNEKFLFYYLKNYHIEKLSLTNGGAVPSLTQSQLNDILIPLPPLEIQSRIVEVLDKMTTLTAELEAELEARKQQYEYYRNKLLSFNEIGEANRQVTWKKISEIGQICMCKRIMKDQTHKQGEIPFYKIGTFGGTADAYISRELFEDYRARFKFPKKGDLLISAAGTIGKTVVFDGKDSYFQDSNIVWVDNDETIVTNRYLYHIYKIINWKTDGGTIRRLYNDNLRNTIIPVPSMQEQQRIVSILDRFEALTTDLQSGLPAEIEARRQQYEYYRNKLLTFEAV